MSQRILEGTVQRLLDLSDALKKAARPGSESETILLLAASLVGTEAVTLKTHLAKESQP
jgi:hypothetical protein